ncbi:uncharacterized protein LOC111361843 [Spodoptera litura]|uniref:Uncharacterized protein LOC111352768 n=2 Tax=Spodoptera litura TaxID=69820 RepID=A0A9J7DZJ5_SPOLT|nr:uncharacterized protein LOC111352768 [Spodoptera litura]XP_022821206.1 uncharacterized protein LOC111352781 [Spodoptera litura]XP_022827724.1 uncharacterized protein LOC111357324 [Spodoptera litura]XP_022834040.1 uncharacterized protein LOC111361843 [Spodoptera litura]
MAKQKLQTREERLRKKRLAEKRRYERIKNNAELWKEKQEKNRQNYIRRKEEKKQLPIAEMNPRQQRLQRKRWRKNYKAYYQRKKQEKLTAAMLDENTPPQSPSILPYNEAFHDNLPSLNNQVVNREESPTPGPSRILRSATILQNHAYSPTSRGTTPNTEAPSCSSPVPSVVRRLRYQKDKEINNLKRIILDMKRKNERYKKKLQRLALNYKGPSVDNKIRPKNQNTTLDPKIKRLVRKSNKIPNHHTNSLPELLRKEVEIFYEDDENSRLCSGKKEFITRNKIRKQKRYLNDSLLNLHKKFLKKSNLIISYSAFCKLRPFWVIIPDFRSRDTCLCKLHVNMDLVIQGLYQRKILVTKTSQDLLSLLCCDVYNEDCLHRTCFACKERTVPYQEFDNSIEITYWQWETKPYTIEATGRKVRSTEKIKKREEPKICIEKFESTLNEYFVHCGNVVAQQKAFKYLKENLQEGECIIHVDFSENYAVKCNEEIQSYHFGGSRKQLTLHTSVIYFLDDEKIQQVQSFCTVSECLRHDISAVWAHIVPVLQYIGEKKRDIHTIHFISDSPSSQYRNKKIFHLIACLHIYLSSIKIITWNYSESGHGKGAPDGIGAVMKRTADRAVSQGQDIKDMQDFVNVMEQNLKKVKLRTVSEYDVCEKDFLFPQNVKAFPGCLKMHQIVWNFESPIVAVRKLSCIDQNCLHQTVNCNHKKHLGFYHLEDEIQHNNTDTVTPLADSTRQLREIGQSFWTSSNEPDTQNINTPNIDQRILDEELEFNISHKRQRNHKGVRKSLGINNDINKELMEDNEQKEDRKDNAAERTEMSQYSDFDKISEITFSRDGNKHFSVDLENINPYLIDSDDEEFNIF